MKAQDLFQEVTDKIIAQIESGELPVWQKSWNGFGSMPLNVDGKTYNGGNIIILWIASMAKGYKASNWMTYKQAEKLGGKVKKGEKGTHIYFYSQGEKKNAEGEKEGFMFAKAYCVFNVEQIEGLADKYHIPPTFKNLDEKNRAVSDFILNTDALINHEQGRGNFYSPKLDAITLERFEDFKDAHSYYATALHELTHWTGSKSRLERELVSKKYRDAYAFEELVAELGAAFLCAELGLASEPRQDHAAYLNNWLSALKDDKKFLFKAASEASKAVNYLKDLQHKTEKEIAA